MLALLVLEQFLFRVFHLILMSLHNIYFRLTGQKNCLFDDDVVEFGTIIYRKKFVEADMSGPKDFLWYHNEFATCQTLMNSQWSLYTIDNKFAYFLLMPKPIHEYTVRVAPFVYMKQFEEGLKFARCTLNNFCRLTNGLDDNRGPLVYESSAARSGSTLMAQLLQATDKCTVLGEPDAFTALTNLIDKKQIEEQQIHKIVHSIIKFLCKCQKKSETYVIKTQSNCIRLVPYIKKVSPHVKHFFMFRKNTRRILSSSEKTLRHGTGGDLVIFLWNKVSPSFACWFINFASFEYAFVERFGMKDCMDYAILCHVSAYYEFLKNRSMFDLPWVLYEDVVADPVATLKPILEICQIPADFVQDALKVLNNDSQAGTILSQDSMKNIKSIELTDDKIDQMNEICRILRVPMLDI